MKSPPRIGITCDHVADKPRYSLGYDYVTAVQRAGGLPVLIPFGLDVALIEPLLDGLDGMIFSGGDDPDPALWGEPVHPKIVPLKKDRENFELALMIAVLKRKLPLLGICLGMQLLNIARGGSLIQYLPDHPRPNSIEHRALDHPTFHAVRILLDSQLHNLLKIEYLQVNSRHKQAVGRLGNGLTVAAFAPDGIIEAIEDSSHPFLTGIQWHGENLINHPTHLAIFQKLVETASCFYDA